MLQEDPSHQSVFDRPSALGLTGRQSAEVLPSLVAFLDEHKPIVGRILMGLELEVDKWRNRDLRRLENLVIQKAADAPTARDFLRVLRKACAFWAARERLNLAYPRIPVCAQEPKNPFGSNFPRMLQTYRSWKSVLDKWIEEFASADKTGSKSNSGPAIELLVVSAVLYGGLHSKPALLALVQSAQNAASRSFCVDGRMHVELSLSWHGIPNMEFRRWQPDALSATLWARLQPEAAVDLLSVPADDDAEREIPDREIVKRLEQRLRARLERTADIDRKFIGGLDRLLQAGQTAAYVELPSIMAAYAGRKFISHSLKRQALQRLSKETIVTAVDPQSPLPDSGANRSITSAAGPPRLPEDLEEGALKRLRGSMTSEKSGELRNELAALASRSDASAFEKRMADFGVWLLQVRTRGGKIRTVGSAKRTVIELTRYMVPILDDQDPVSLNTEVLETIYGQMLESTGQPVGDTEIVIKASPTSKRRQILARAILEFHRYMMVEPRNKEALDDGTFLAGEVGLAPVDANLLTVEDYTDVLKEINRVWPTSDDQQTIARILVILSFRTGLRRLEVLHCVTEDIVPGNNAEFLVRPSAMRRLKSRNAKRRVPLRVFLTEEELGEVLAWREKRLANLKPKKSGFLFGVGNNPAPVQQTIIEEINRILMRVTDDDSMHFHELRHSAAGLNWLQLFMADLENPPAPDLFPERLQTTEWLRQGPAKRALIYGHDRTTRKHTFQLTQLLGHGNPATFMQSYQHFSDFGLAVCLERSALMRPKDELVEFASGRSASTLERWGSRASPMVVPLRLWARRLSKLPRQLPTPKVIPEHGWIWPAYNYLRESDVGNRTVEEVYEMTGLDSTTGQLFCDRAQYLFDMPSGIGDRHRMETYYPGPQSEQPARRLVCPASPAGPDDKEVVEYFAPVIANAVQGQRAVVESGLDSYVHNVWRSRGITVFRDPDKPQEAIAFVDMLKALDIQRQDLRWYCFKSDRAERSKFLPAWKMIFGLNQHDSVERISPPNKKSSTPEKWLGIAPRLDGYITAIHSKSPGIFGFRFLMLMGFIALSKPPLPALTGKRSTAGGS